MAPRLHQEHIDSFVDQYQTSGKVDEATLPFKDAVVDTDVFIAGSGPIGCGFASEILRLRKNTKVFMADIGARDSPVIGHHPKNAIKYQKDIDAFVNVIKGALQTISVPPSDTFIPTLYGEAWTPSVDKPLIIYGHNPNQAPELNLKASAVTRVVGGMATHWTCACPLPHAEERSNNPIPPSELDSLLTRSRKILDVTTDQYDNSIRHNTVLEALKKGTDLDVQPLPLAVRRRKDNPAYVTWSGSDTVLGEAANNPNFTLSPETRVTEVIYGIPWWPVWPPPPWPPKKWPTANEWPANAPEGWEGKWPPTGWKDCPIWPEWWRPRAIGVLIRDLKTDTDRFIRAKTVVIACGAVGTPQVLFNSGIRPWALGRYMTEQSLSFCQIVLKKSYIDAIPNDPRWKERVKKHREDNPGDPLPIPFDDPEPQVNLPYSTKHPWHVQIHRDAFSYGDVGPKADPRLIVDLRWFGKQDIQETNRVYFGPKDEEEIPAGWTPGVTDSYGMPQATFEWRRSANDNTRDQAMMKEMCDVANVLGSYLPGSYPQFMDPGLVLHITGTTRIGKDPETSVADAESRVHGFSNLWVGGNGCIPDSTACNPTATSLAFALKASKSITDYLDRPIPAYNILKYTA